jgi:hypothetical protein
MNFSVSRQKFFYEFCGLCSLGTLAQVDIATFSCFNHAYLRVLAFRETQAPWPLEIVTVIRDFHFTPFYASKSFKKHI